MIVDRALQARVVNALEPEWEARFESRSYGFRPGRSCHDAIEAIFNVARGANPRLHARRRPYRGPPWFCHWTSSDEAEGDGFHHFDSFLNLWLGPAILSIYAVPNLESSTQPRSAVVVISR